MSYEKMKCLAHVNWMYRFNYLCPAHVGQNLSSESKFFHDRIRNTIIAPCLMSFFRSALPFLLSLCPGAGNISGKFLSSLWQVLNHCTFLNLLPWLVFLLFWQHTVHTCHQTAGLCGQAFSFQFHQTSRFRLFLSRIHGGKYISRSKLLISGHIKQKHVAWWSVTYLVKASFYSWMSLPQLCLLPSFHGNEKI